MKATGIVTGLGLLGLMLLLALVVTQRGSGGRGRDIAVNAGALGLVGMAVGYGAIWTTYHATADQRRRAEARRRKARMKRERDAG